MENIFRQFMSNKTGYFIKCKQCEKQFYAPGWRLRLNRQFCSSNCYHKNSRGKTSWNKGIKKWWKSPTQFKVGQTLGENNVNWKGGITRDFPRFTRRYKLWRKKIFERDNYTCVWCKQRGGQLEADHILPQSLYPEKRYNISNGRTLCKKCHRKTETFGHKVLRKNIYEYL